jgi:probable HAF family extracellular repeat protein
MRLPRSLLVAALSTASFLAPVAGTEVASARPSGVPEPDPVTFVRVGTLGRAYGAAVMNRRGDIAFTASAGNDRVTLWDQGTTTPVTPAGRYPTEAWAVNEHRTVVGRYENGAGDPGGPFIWKGGAMRLLGPPGDLALDVNERDEVLLSRRTADTTSYRASTVREGRERVSPDVLDGRVLTGAAINNTGYVAGTAPTGDLLPPRPDEVSVEALSEPPSPVRQAFIWKPGETPVALDNVAGALSTESHSINNAGSVIGWMVMADHVRRTFLWRDGEMVDLGTLGGQETYLAQLNERDQVVGTSQRRDAIHAFRWTDGEMLDLGTLGGPNSAANGLNNHGDVVGESQTASGHWSAFLWRDGRMIDLGALVPDAQWSRATAIDNRGQVLGLVVTAAGPQFVVWDTLGRG